MFGLPVATYQHFMAPEGSLMYRQKPAIGLYPVSYELNSRLPSPFLRPILIPNCMSLRFPTLCYMDFFSLLFVLHSLPNHTPRFDHHNNIWREAQIKKLTVIQFYSALCSLWGTNIIFSNLFWNNSDYIFPLPQEPSFTTTQINKSQPVK